MTVPASRIVYRRGFAEVGTWSSADWIQHADDIVKQHPIREVRLTTLPLTWSTIADSKGEHILCKVFFPAGHVWHQVAVHHDKRPYFYERECTEEVLSDRFPKIKFHLPEPT